MKYAVFFLLVVILAAACISDEAAAPTSDAPRLINEETLPPPTITPLRLLTHTPTDIAETTPTMTSTPETTSELGLLVTLTPPDSPTPTTTDTATTTRIPTRTRTPMPSLTSTPTITLTPTITFTPSITSPPSAIPEGSCPYAWFFSPAPPNCPFTEVVMTQAAFQAMQNGFMIWTQSGLTIYVAFNDSRFPAWIVAPDTFVESEPEVDFNLQIPQGLLQPRRGFGKLWRGDKPLQERLGWATTAELGYTASVQTDSVTGTRYLSGPQGEIFVLLPDQSRWYRAK
ncbi:MAG: hypothetical protein K8I82_08080 [Anaerolineae bacterium]|nr:hypothetical protein [Anaerolineae bacterium]